jgi:hypothetical protein
VRSLLCWGRRHRCRERVPVLAERRVPGSIHARNLTIRGRLDAPAGNFGISAEQDLVIEKPSRIFVTGHPGNSCEFCAGELDIDPGGEARLGGSLISVAGNEARLLVEAADIIVDSRRPRRSRSAVRTRSSSWSPTVAASRSSRRS